MRGSVQPADSNDECSHDAAATNTASTIVPDAAIQAVSFDDLSKQLSDLGTSVAADAANLKKRRLSVVNELGAAHTEDKARVIQLNKTLAKAHTADQTDLEELQERVEALEDHGAATLASLRTLYQRRIVDAEVDMLHLLLSPLMHDGGDHEGGVASRVVLDYYWDRGITQDEMKDVLESYYPIHLTTDYVRLSTNRVETI